MKTSLKTTLILSTLLLFFGLNTVVFGQKMTIKATVGGDSISVAETAFSKIVHFKNSYYAVDKNGKDIYRGQNLDKLTAQPLSAHLRQQGIPRALQDSFSRLYPGLEWDFAHFQCETFHLEENQLYFHFKFAMAYTGDEWGKKYIILVFRLPIFENGPLDTAELLFSFTDNSTIWHLENIFGNVFMKEPAYLVDYYLNQPKLGYLFTFDELKRDSLYPPADSAMAQENRVHLKKDYLKSGTNYLTYADLSPYGFQKANYLSTGYAWLNLTNKSILCETPDNYDILSPLFIFENEPHYLGHYFIQNGPRKTDLSFGELRCIRVRDGNLTFMDQSIIGFTKYISYLGEYQLPLNQLEGIKKIDGVWKHIKLEF